MDELTTISGFLAKLDRIEDKLDRLLYESCVPPDEPYVTDAEIVTVGDMISAVGGDSPPSAMVVDPPPAGEETCYLCPHVPKCE